MRLTTRDSEACGRLPDLPSIHLRPPEANEHLLPGHWEGDLIIGAHNRSAIGVLVCRHSLFLMLAKVEDTTSLGVLEGFRRTCIFSPLPGERRQTLTYDQGKEVAQHRKSSELTDLRSTSPTRTALGNVASVKTPTACCTSTSPRARICRCTRNGNWMRWPGK